MRVSINGRLATLVSTRIINGVWISVYEIDNEYVPAIDTGVGELTPDIKTKTIPGCYAAVVHYLNTNRGVSGWYLEEETLPKKKPVIRDQLVYMILLIWFAFFTGFFAAYWVLADRFAVACCISLVCSLVFFFEYKKLYCK